MRPVSILYILGNGSKWSNNELRYSLRSIAKFGRNIEGVYLCGIKPSFISYKVHFYPCKDVYTAPAHNIVNKISTAISNFSGLTEYFLLSSDDHFYIKDTDFGAYPNYVKGWLPNRISSGIYGDKRYTQTLINTREVCEKLGLGSINCAQHANSWISKTAWRGLTPAWEMGYHYTDGIEPVVVMYNKLFGGRGLTKRADCKIKATKDRAELLKLIGEREVFSIYNSAINNVLIEYFDELFPTPCEYEKA